MVPSSLFAQDDNQNITLSSPLDLFSPMPFAKVTYPPPPPTYNVLSSQERSQFVRSTKKIGKVLGSAPHLFDDSHKAGVYICFTLPV